MPDEPLAWLLTITRNVLANQHRGESRRLLLTARLAAERPDSEAAPTPGGLDEDLIAALRRIPADDRELLCLLAWERLSREQAARVLGCRPAALRLRLHRARRRLERELDAATPGRLSRGATRTPTSPAEGDPT
jgi:RNA polymerase sigma-70 factor (ECF subfamily)